ncbi:disintegrin and metalloproteinase domain-containing protein 32 isoform X8 [Homo sapiens]|uniref:disintegrin and metalloproteinase domain-containing protein 32 isoform X8 n=1 Tax=Homo sapiens TaxID=9606 RepID=UPI0007DC7045|nr:disintegrin and metalloproteinase domain-containing protein 32 isoform X8 [Homo sapiens]|eukprot:XP_016868675.1 disintegrin and metalloproteinase domain-containing protein 32 isoform X9 [Homo sapiens]
MFRLWLLLAGLCGLLASRPGFQNSLLQIVIPEKIQTNTNDSSEIEYEQISYIIPIDEKLYTVHLKQRYFLADNFMIYLYNQGSMNTYSSDIQTQCYYQGNIEGYPDSMVTLSTCSGLRGILQFENVSYGIEPLESAVEFQHVLYKLKNEDNDIAIFIDRSLKEQPMDDNIFISEKYPKEITLEAFAVIVTQMLALSLGISYDDPKKCQCSESTCIMNPEVVQSNGVKTFSSCSLRSFQNFISNVGVKCLQNKPQMQKKSPKPVCGNGRLEGNEICDCGTEAQCGPASCCDFRTCVLKDGAKCYKGLCCKDCQILQSGVECRPKAHPECDIAENCNGTSPECGPDITLINGLSCKNNKFICYDGDCHDLDARCESVFGKGSRNAPFACYEEIQSQSDRFGNCGRDRNNKYVFCGWRNLICGRLVCTYPTRKPFHQENGDVIYAFVRDSVCITVDYKLPRTVPDPLAVKNGSQCDIGRVCVNRECVESRIIKASAHVCSQQCSGHGVCDSRNKCHCSPGYKPPNCQIRSKGFSIFPEEDMGSIMERASGKTENTWLLGFLIALPILIVTTAIVLARKQLKKWFAKEEEFPSSESKSEGSTQTYASQSSSEGSTQTYASQTRSESSSQADTSKSKSEDSAEAYTSRSKSQDSTQTQSSSN